MVFRIAIIGGGLGGLFAALSIHHQCPSEKIQIDVYEQAPQYKEIGAGVGLGPNASRLVEKIGLLDDALKIAGKRDDIWFTFRRYDTGSEVLRVSMPEGGRMKQLPMHRADLLDLLVKAIQKRGAATLHTNKQCRELEDKGDTTVVTFADGTTTEANLVIGADGIHSAVRGHYIDDTPQYGQMVVYRGLCPISEIEDKWDLPAWSTIWMAPGKHFLTFPICNSKVLNIVAFVTTPWEKLGEHVKESWTLTSHKSEVQEEFKDFAPMVQLMMEKMDANPLKWVLFDRKGLQQWNYSNGKVTLLGDAAHAMCPHQGAGAGQAIEDGYILGRALQDYLQALDTPNQHSLRECLDLYQAIRLPRAEKVQLTSRQAGDLYEMQCKEVTGLSYDEGLPIVADILKDRMKWIWTDDIDQAYEKVREKINVAPASL